MAEDKTDKGSVNAACNAADGKVVDVSAPGMGDSQYAYQKVTLNGQEHLLRVSLTGDDAMIDLLPGCGEDPKVAISIMGGMVTREVGKNSEMLKLSDDEAGRVVEQIRQAFKDTHFSVQEANGLFDKGKPLAGAFSEAADKGRGG